MRIAFTRWRSGGLFNRRSPRKRLLPTKKTSSGFELVSGLADGASAMPAKWSRPVFSFRFYEGKISRALIVIQHLGGKHTARRHRAPRLMPLMRAGLDDISDDRFVAEVACTPPNDVALRSGTKRPRKRHLENGVHLFLALLFALEALLQSDNCYACDDRTRTDHTTRRSFNGADDQAEPRRATTSMGGASMSYRRPSSGNRITLT
jgi:hypothetical protein